MPTDPAKMFNTPKPDDGDLSVSQAANVLNISPSTLRRFEEAQKIKSVRLANGYRVFHLKDILILKDALASQSSLETSNKYPPQHSVNQLGMSTANPHTPHRRLPIAKPAAGILAVSLLGVIAVAATFGLRPDLAKTVGRLNPNHTQTTQTTTAPAILGATDRTTDYSFNVNVRSIFKKIAEFQENSVFSKSLKVTDNLSTASLTFTNAGTLNQLLAIDDVTKATLTRTLEVAGDVTSSGTGLANLSIKAGVLDGTEFADSVTVEGILDIKTLKLDGTEVTVTADDLNQLANITLNSNELELLSGAEATDGGILFGDGSSFTQNTANLFWDDTNLRLGLKTATPRYTLDVTGDIGLASGGNIYIGTVGIKDTGTTSTTSGAALIGVYDEFTNSNGTTLQQVLADFDAQFPIPPDGHDAVTLAGSYDYITLSGQQLTLNQIDLATDVTGSITVATGGTGATTFTTNGVLYGNGTSALQATAAPTSGQVLIGSALGVPTFNTLSGDISINGTGVTSIQNDAVVLGTDTTGNYVTSIANGSGISGGNEGSESAALTLALGNLTADWEQTGAFDILLRNSGAEISILESLGNSYYGTLDVGDLAANATYTFSGASGTVLTDVNATSLLSGWDTNASDDLTTGTTFSGDVSGAYNNLQLGTGVVDATELAATGVSAGSYGSSSQIPVLTIDADGRITAATTQALSAEAPLTFQNGLTRTTNTVELGGNLTQSTTITADNAEVLAITNTGSGNSFLVNDAAGDTTPFVIDNAGNVGVATTTLNAHLAVGQAVGDTSSLQVWQDSSGNPVASVTWQGGFINSGQLDSYAASGQTIKLSNGGDMKIMDGSSQTLFQISHGTGNPIFNQYSTSGVGLRVKAAAGQTADLQQWLNSSDTPLAYIDANGSMHITSGQDYYVGSIGLNDTASATTSGAYILGVFDEFANSNSTTVQDVLDDLDSAISSGLVSADSLDFTELKDTLALDAALVLNQTSNSWTQTYTGTSNAGLTYTSSGAVTSGNAATLDINVSNASTSVPAVMLTYAGSGNVLVINDDGTSSDPTPVTINDSGQVIIGGTTPLSYSTMLQANGPDNAAIAIVAGNSAGTTDLRFKGLYNDNAQWWAIGQAGNSERFRVINYWSGKEAMTFTPSGPVGIGNITPSALLSIGTAGTTAGSMSLAGGSSGTLTLDVPDTITSFTLTLPSADGASNTVLYTDGTGNLAFGTVGSLITADSLDFTELKDTLALDASTDIAADNAEVLSITNTGTGNSFLVNDVAGDTSPLVIDAAGNVAIGATTATYKLDVVGGDIYTSGDLRVAGDDLFMTTNTLGSILVADGTNFNPVVISGDITIDGTGATTIGANTVALTTDTTGNYVTSITNGSGISGGNGGSEGAALTLALGALTADWNQTGAFDISLNNASSELKLLESVGDTFFGTLDIGDLSADATYTFTGATGSVVSDTNATSLLSAWDSTASDDLTTGTTFAGDVTGAYNNLQLGSGVVDAAELASSGVTAASYGSATEIPILTIDADGRITVASTTTATGDISAVGSMTSGLAFGDSTADDDWLGLGASAGRIEFDDQTTDEVNIVGANVGIGTSSPSAVLDILSPAAAVTSSVTGTRITAAATNTTTNNIDKLALSITSTGTFTGGAGVATKNYGIYIAEPTGADNNYSIFLAGTGQTRIIDSTAGGYLSNTGVWTDSSSKTKKENFEDVDYNEILAKIDQLTVQKWNYITDESENKHIGPFAEDFYSIFNVGESDQNLASLDTAGIALAGIKGLVSKVSALETRLNTIALPQTESDQPTKLLANSSYAFDNDLETGTVAYIKDTTVKQVTSETTIQAAGLVLKTDTSSFLITSGVTVGKLTLAEDEFIESGDLLTASATGGVKKRTTESLIIGKALESVTPQEVSEGKTTIMLLLDIQWRELAQKQDSETSVPVIREDDLKLLGNLTVVGNAVLGQTTITKNLKVGLINLDPETNEFSLLGAKCLDDQDLCLNQTLFIQKNLAGNVDFLNGAVVFEASGKVRFSGDVTMAGLTFTQDSKVIGTAKLEPGEQQTTVKTSGLREEAKVFVTPTSPLQGNYYIEKDPKQEAFSIKLSESNSEPVSFDWFIINIDMTNQ